MNQIPVRMPKMSMTMTEGEVVSWAIEPGAQVQAGDTVCEVLTDKVDMEVEAPVSGRLVRIDVETGIVDVGTPIAWIESEEDDPLEGLFDEPPAPEGAAPDPALSEAAEQPQAAAAVPPPAAPTPEPAPADRGPVPAVPRARAMARDAGVDLTGLDGSGPEGRVLVADVERYLAAKAPAAAPTAAPVRPAAQPGARGRRADAIRAAVARSMTASAQVPQFTVWRDLDLGPAQDARGRVSWTTLLLRAYAAGLREVPALLGRWDGQRAVPVEELGIGLAVDTPEGLLVPVFADPDLVAVEELDADLRASISNARGGRVTADHLLPAVATLSNLGGLGVDRFQALVTPPQASVLAAGAIDSRPVAVPGGVGLGLRVTVGLSVDHRVADGAHGARLLAAVAAALAEPLRLVGPVRQPAGAPVSALVGVGVSAGRVVGPVARLGARCAEPADGPAPADPDSECGRLATALAAVADDLQRRADAAVGSIADIIAATAMMAQDPGLRVQSQSLVVQHRLPAARAVWLVAEQYAQTLAAAGGYLAERVADLFDVRDRVVARLTGAGLPGLPEPGHPYVLVARDLSPADTALLDVGQVLALITEEGGPTGHTAIIARSLGLPAVVACPGAAALVDGQVVSVDGSSGLVDPDADPAQATTVARPRTAIRLPEGPVTTLDGRAVRVLANVGGGAAARRARELGAVGSGLFRSELLFLDREQAPGVEEQRAAYVEVLQAFAGDRVVARTLDAGADKPLPFLQMADEPNPALGVRGLRVAAADEQVLVDQLTALAAARDETGTETWVMAPMVATVEEARWFRGHCTRAGLPTVGVMVEVPSAALMADELLEVVDFLSIGTNDLAQYTMAADRLSGRLAALNDPWQPAVLRLVRTVAAAGVRAGKPVGVCGEAAADPLLACVLVGLGVVSLSADAGALAAVAEALVGVSAEQCAQAALGACAAASPQQARAAAARHLEATTVGATR